MDDTDRKIRYEVFQFILDRCRPPTIQDLANRTSIKEQDVVASLAKLEDLHHLKLYGEGVPSPTPIAMVHPFSHLPTPYRVSTGTKSWFANCSWCAFGLAAMLSPAEVIVEVMSPTSGKQLSFRIVNTRIETVSTITGSLPMEDCYTTFCVPPLQWWIDVHFACSNIQMCTSKEEAEDYHRRHGFHNGEVMDLNTLWELSKAWYCDKASYEYERKTPGQARSLFESLGMVSDFWSLNS